MKLKHLILSVLTISLMMSCGTENPSDSEFVLTEIEPENIIITDAQFDLGEMEFDSFTNQPFHRVIKTTGMLDVPPENKATVSAYFGGYVKNISLLEGQEIKKGQTLFTLENPDYIQVQQDFLEAKNQLNYLESDYKRQKELAKDNVNSQKVFLKSESDYRVMLTRYESLKKKLQLMNIDPNSLNETNLRTSIVVRAPISGYVTAVLATKGLFLNPSDVALTIMNTEHMHVELTVFEKDLAQVAIGQEVSFGVQNNPTRYQAIIHLINKAIDPEKRTINIHCHLVNENETALFTPGMYVEADIYASSDSTMALPKEAIISVENKHYVLVNKNKTAEGYELDQVEVQVGQINADYIEILNTHEFTAKTEFLIKGAFNLIQE
ncbi:MAG: efflux RND transporter periplasmic adaptor subunit [Crocinitomix sp.]|nr:efflux RND transporter periplasmic adaptor subunit [Crocinitomix sp.]